MMNSAGTMGALTYYKNLYIALQGLKLSIHPSLSKGMLNPSHDITKVYIMISLPPRV